jgi:hypothetical protein
MDSGTWEAVLIGALIVNALLGLAYRGYRMTKGGPRADVVGGTILGALLVGLALAMAVGAGWPRWGALAYGLVFGLVVMPLWVLAVLIPLRPKAIDYAFTGVYWTVALTVAVAALAV